MIFFLCLYNSKNGCGALFLTGVPVERLLGSDVVASASGLDGARRYLRDPCRYGDECVGVGVDVDVGMGVGVHGGGRECECAHCACTVMCTSCISAHV